MFDEHQGLTIYFPFRMVLNFQSSPKEALKKDMYTYISSPCFLGVVKGRRFLAPQEPEAPETVGSLKMTGP